MLKPGRTIFLPLQLTNHVIANKLYKPFGLLVYLKFNCSGKIQINTADFDRIGKELRKSGRTIRNNLKKLLELNWVGYNPKSKYYFVRSFGKIMQMFGFKTKSYAEFEEKDILLVKDFVFAAGIGQMINTQIRNKRKKIAATHQGVINIAKLPTIQDSLSFPISNLAASKCLNISKSGASKLKKQTSLSGFIKVQHSYKKTPFDVSYIHLFKAGNPEIAHCVAVEGGKVAIMMPDMVSHKIRFKTRGFVSVFKLN